MTLLAEPQTLAPALLPAIAPPAVSSGDRIRLRRSLARYEQVLEITRLVTSETNLDRLLLLIAEKTTVALNAERATVYIVDAKAQQLAMRVASEVEVRQIRLPLGVG